MFGIGIDECSIAVLRDERGKYVHFAGMAPLFYDLERDPDELVNRAADPEYAATVLDYAQRLLSFRMRNAERTLDRCVGHAAWASSRPAARAAAGCCLGRSRSPERRRPDARSPELTRL